MNVYSVIELRNLLNKIINNGYGDVEVKITGTDFILLNKADDERFNGFYSKEDIFNAIYELTNLYRNLDTQKMTFSELAIVENTLIHFKDLLLKGDVRVERDETD